MDVPSEADQMELAEAETVDEHPDKNARGRFQKNFTEIKDRTGAVLHRIEGGAREGLRLANLYLRGAQLQGAMLRGANLQDSDLREADLSDADLEGATFDDAKLDNANLTGANLRKTRFPNVSARKAIFNLADLTQASWEKADLEHASFIRATLEELTVGGALLKGAKFFEARLRGSEFYDCDLWAAVFQGADLSHASIGGCDLRCANLLDAKVKNAIFSSVRLENANLYQMDCGALQWYHDVSFGTEGASFDRSTKWPLSLLPIKAIGIENMYTPFAMGFIPGGLLVYGSPSFPWPLFLLTPIATLTGYVLWRLLHRTSYDFRMAVRVKDGKLILGSADSSEAAQLPPA